MEIIRQSQLKQEDFGLGAIANHNALHPITVPTYNENLNLYELENLQDDGSSALLTPCSSPPQHCSSERERKCQRKDSPLAQDYRVSKSPAARPKNEIDRIPQEYRFALLNPDQLEVPLSQLTKDMATDLVNVGDRANRSAKARQAEVEQSENKKVKRPENCFILYRNAYAERVKVLFDTNNHQKVSKICGPSWKKETFAIQTLYKDLAKLEKDKHMEAFPDYSFRPKKAATARVKTNSVHDEDRDYRHYDDEEDDSDGEYFDGPPSKRRRLIERAPSRRSARSKSRTRTPVAREQDSYNARDRQLPPASTQHQDTAVAVHPQQLYPLPIYTMPQYGMPTGYTNHSADQYLYTHEVSPGTRPPVGQYGIPGGYSMGHVEDFFVNRTDASTPIPPQTRNPNSHSSVIHGYSHPFNMYSNSYQPNTDYNYNVGASASGYSAIAAAELRNHRQYVHQQTAGPAIDPELDGVGVSTTGPTAAATYGIYHTPSSMASPAIGNHFEDALSNMHSSDGDNHSFYGQY